MHALGAKYLYQKQSVIRIDYQVWKSHLPTHCSLLSLHVIISVISACKVNSC